MFAKVLGKCMLDDVKFDNVLASDLVIIVNVC